MLSRVKINRKPLVTMMKNKSEFGTYDKIVFAIRSLLNKMSNEDSRTYAQNVQQTNKNAPIKEQTIPKNELEAQKMFQSGQKTLSKYQKGRLQRIDDILGTSTHFHETKLYQQRIDSEHIINIEELAKKFKEPDRWKLDATNPQLVANIKIKERRKYFQALKKLRSYPLPTQDLTSFQEITNDQSSNTQLMKMLAQEALFTKLSLRQLDLTLQSIHNQKLLLETDDGIIQAELDGQDYIFNGKIYFRPTYSLSMFRIDEKLFNKKMITSIDGMDEYLGKPNSPLEQLFNMDQIYQCLQQYYYDERVSQLLAKIQNNQLQYFISKMFLSPDAKHICIMIDMIGTKSEYVCLYKCVDPNEKNVFSEQNVIFNVKPQMAIRNQGIGYFIQRSQNGMYTQLMKCQFNTHTPKIQNKQQIKDNKQLQRKENQKSVARQLSQQIIHTCLPHLQLQILENKQAKTDMGNGGHFVSKNILIQEYDLLNNKVGNKVYLLQEGQQQLQEITANGMKILNIIGIIIKCYYKILGTLQQTACCPLPPWLQV